MSGGPLRNGLAPVPQGVVFFHDVSEHRRELQAITLLSRVVEQTADSVMLTDKQGKIEYVNPAFEATSGYNRSDVLGRTPRILNPACTTPDSTASYGIASWKDKPFVA